MEKPPDPLLAAEEDDWIHLQKAATHFINRKASGLDSKEKANVLKSVLSQTHNLIESAQKKAEEDSVTSLLDKMLEQDWDEMTDAQHAKSLELRKKMRASRTKGRGWKSESSSDRLEKIIQEEKEKTRKMMEEMMLPTEGPAVFDEFKIRTFYKTTLHPTAAGVCNSVAYHTSGCITINLRTDRDGKLSFLPNVPSTQFIGYDGDPTNPPDVVKEVLGKKVLFTRQNIVGVCIVYSIKEGFTDQVLIEYMNKLGEVCTVLVDKTEVELVLDEPQEVSSDIVEELTEDALLTFPDVTTGELTARPDMEHKTGSTGFIASSIEFS